MNARLKAIETPYKGHRFRSRLEARWAVFFDAAGIGWVYEPEGFDLGGAWYLPDFWLPDHELWVEIKPTLPSEREIQLMRTLSRMSECDGVILAGQPWPLEYHVRHWHREDRGETSLDDGTWPGPTPKFSHLGRCEECGGLAVLEIKDVRHHDYTCAYSSGHVGSNSCFLIGDVAFGGFYHDKFRPARAERFA